MRQEHYQQLGPFTGGIDNVNNPRSLGPNTLREAVDLDVDNTGFLELRPIIETVHATASRSLFGNQAGTIGLVAEGVNLRRVNSDDSRTTIYSGLNAGRNVCYAEYLDMIYFSDGVIIGRTDGYTVSLLSNPDNRPYKEVMRAGDIIAFHNDRLYSVKGGLIRFSDSKSVQTADRRFCRKYAPGNIVMFKPVADGIWLSFGGRTYFASGLDPAIDGLNIRERAPYGAIGQAVDVPREQILPGSQGFDGETIMWQSEQGTCIGGNGGIMLNLSKNKYKIASGMRSAASFYRARNGSSSHFISVMKN